MAAAAAAGGSLTSVGGGEDGGGGGEAQHLTDHLSIEGVKVVVTHRAPHSVVPDLHTTSGRSRYQAHVDWGVRMFDQIKCSTFPVGVAS